LGSNKNSKQDDENQYQPDGIIGNVFATAEWLLIAFSVTLVFIVFFMQAYTIPTGSMADTLRGAHFRLRCEQCGYGYEYGFLPRDYNMPENKTPSYNVLISSSKLRCPSCGFHSRSGQKMPVMKGDRIFVAKCIYQFTDPKRWDVVVFKNPTDPKINFIKRLIAKPGEEVEIIDGDIYIDGNIARKPKKIQEELWMPVYDNDYRPIDPDASGFNGHRWSQPFVNAEKSEWDLSAQNGSVFKLDAGTDDMHTLVYDTRKGNDFRATYAYNNASIFNRHMPVCSDLMVRFTMLDPDWTGKIGVGLSKYGVKYFGWVESEGKMKIIKVKADGTNEVLAEKETKVNGGADRKFQFANVDHRLVLDYGKQSLVYDFGTLPDDAGTIPERKNPVVMIFGGGKLQIAHVAVFRDIHYLSEGRNIQRASRGDPFKLGKDQYFVCGDNSPNSQDARMWAIPGIGNGDTEYRAGTVPGDYLVGKAFFVYWPGGFKPHGKSKIRLVPYIGGMKRISGG
jgi:signal peptidase I